MENRAIQILSPAIFLDLHHLAAACFATARDGIMLPTLATIASIASHRAPDPVFPENNPHALWQALHGCADIWGELLGPGRWPYPPELIDWLELVIYGDVLRPLGFGDRPARPTRGAPIVRSMPARFRLAGPFVLRKLPEQDALEAFAGRDGFYYRRIEGKLIDHRYYTQSEIAPYCCASITSPAAMVLQAVGEQLNNCPLPLFLIQPSGGLFPRTSTECSYLLNLDFSTPRFIRIFGMFERSNIR